LSLLQAGDLSVLTPPVMTSLTGMRQALHALEAGTPDVKAVLLNEVNLVYECRVCFNMFRSLANLVSHKARFCRQRYADVRHEFADKKGGDGDEENAAAAFTTVIIEPEPVKDCCSSTTDPGSWDLATYSPSMELIKTAGILEDLGMAAAATAVTERPLIDRLHPGSSRKRGLSSILSQLSGRRPPMLPSSHHSTVSGLTVRLEPVYSTTNALYQSWRLTDEQGTVYPSVKDLNMTLQRIVIGDEHTVVGPDGLAVVAEDSNPQPAAQQKSGGGEKTTPALQSNGKAAADNEELRQKKATSFWGQKFWDRN
jgi:hypothetical protein